MQRLMDTNLPNPAMAKPVVILDYDPKWPALFQFFRRRIGDALGGAAAAIEHVGSTSVPGLAAKPIIDIDVLLRSDAMLWWAIDRLATLGYLHRGNLGVPGREAFHAPANDPAHHLYLCPPGSSEFQRHMAFRDYLRAHPEDANAYSELKKGLAVRFRKDRIAYNDAKAEFVAGISSRAIAMQKR